MDWVGFSIMFFMGMLFMAPFFKRIWIYFKRILDSI